MLEDELVGCGQEHAQRTLSGQKRENLTVIHQLRDCRITPGITLSLIFIQTLLLADGTGQTIFRSFGSINRQTMETNCFGIITSRVHICQITPQYPKELYHCRRPLLKKPGLVHQDQAEYQQQPPINQNIPRSSYLRRVLQNKGAK